MRRIKSMNHKRKRPKSRRAGCLLCKWHKDEKFKDTYSAQTMQEKKARERDRNFKEDINIAA